MKICKKCGVEKNLEDFPIFKEMKDGHRNECKLCTKEWKKQHYIKNKIEIDTKNKIWRQNNIERVRETNKIYKAMYGKQRYHSNLERSREQSRKDARKFRERHPELSKKRSWEGYLKFKKEHPDRIRLHKKNYNHKRRNLEMQGDVTTEQLNELIDGSNNVCFWCDTYTEKIHLDHITPLAKGGKHTINNLVVSCPECNFKKGAKDPEVFLEEILSQRFA